jgi:hypothetical protein
MTEPRRTVADYARLQPLYAAIVAEGRRDRMSVALWLAIVAQRLVEDDVEMRAALAAHMHQLSVQLDGDIENLRWH